jgi:hypothetical protein
MNIDSFSKLEGFKYREKIMMSFKLLMIGKVQAGKII